MQRRNRPEDVSRPRTDWLRRLGSPGLVGLFDQIGEAAEAELAANAVRLKTKEWPFAVTELYLGKRSPAALLDEMLSQAPEQERLESWIMSQVEQGAALPGLYPPNAENKARYQADTQANAASKTGPAT